MTCLSNFWNLRNSGGFYGSGESSNLLPELATGVHVYVGYPGPLCQ